MQQVISAALFLVVLLRGAFIAGKHYPEGTQVQVTRDDRNAMVASGGARDATEQEIKGFQGAEGVVDDETSASIAVAASKLETLENLRNQTQIEFNELVDQRDRLNSEIEGLTTQRNSLGVDVGDLTKQREDLSAEVAKLVAAAAAAKKPAK